MLLAASAFEAVLAPPAEVLALAQPLPLSTAGRGQVDGTLADGGTADYVLYAPIRGKMRISAIPLDGSGLQPTLELFDGYGRQVSSQAAPATDGALETFFVEPPDLLRLDANTPASAFVYYLRVGAAEGSSGAFRLKIDMGNTAFSETSLDFDEASPVEFGPAGVAALSGSVALGGATVYRMVAPFSGLLSIRQTATAGDLDSFIYFYDGVSSLLSANDDAKAGVPNSLAQANVVVGQTYYIVAAGADGTSGTFNLNLDFRSTFDRSEPLIAGADGESKATGTIGLAGVVRPYSLIAPLTGTLLIRLEQGNGSALDSVLGIFDADHRWVAGDHGAGGPGSSVVLRRVTAGEIIQLTASGYETTTGGFLLSTSYLGQDGVPTVLNSNADGTVESIEGAVAASGAFTTYAWTAPRAGRMTFWLDAVPGNAVDVQAYVFGPAGELLGESGATGHPWTVQFDAAEGVTYRLAVVSRDRAAGPFHLSGGFAGPRLRTAGASVDDPVLVRTDSVNEAVLRDVLSTDTEAAYYRIVVPDIGVNAGTLYTLNVLEQRNGLVGAAPLRFELFDDQGNPLSFDQQRPRPGGVTLAIENNLTRGRTVIVKVSGRDGAIGPYEVRIRLEKVLDPNGGLPGNLQVVNSQVDLPVPRTATASALPPAIIRGPVDPDPPGGSDDGIGGGSLGSPLGPFPRGPEGPGSDPGEGGTSSSGGTGTAGGGIFVLTSLRDSGLGTVATLLASSGAEGDGVASGSSAPGVTVALKADETSIGEGEAVASASDTDTQTVGDESDRGDPTFAPTGAIRLLRIAQVRPVALRVSAWKWINGDWGKLVASGVARLGRILLSLKVQAPTDGRSPDPGAVPAVAPVPNEPVPAQRPAGAEGAANDEALPEPPDRTAIAAMVVSCYAATRLGRRRSVARRTSKPDRRATS